MTHEQIAKGRKTRGIMASVFFGLLAFCVAKEAGVPIWRDWDVGDATDIGVLAFFFAYYAVRAILEKQDV